MDRNSPLEDPRRLTGRPNHAGRQIGWPSQSGGSRLVGQSEGSERPKADSALRCLARLLARQVVRDLTLTEVTK